MKMQCYMYFLLSGRKHLVTSALTKVRKCWVKPEFVPVLTSCCCWILSPAEAVSCCVPPPCTDPADCSCLHVNTMFVYGYTFVYKSKKKKKEKMRKHQLSANKTLSNKEKSVPGLSLCSKGVGRPDSAAQAERAGWKKVVEVLYPFWCGCWYRLCLSPNKVRKVDPSSLLVHRWPCLPSGHTKFLAEVIVVFTHFL